MRYRLVVVDPLRPFPLLSFGLANITSFGDAEAQVRQKFGALAEAEIASLAEVQALKLNIKGFGEAATREKTKEGKKALEEQAAKLLKELDGICDPIRQKYTALANEEVVRLEAQKEKFETALTLHLSRQERRLAHFKSCCRFKGCDNPHPLGSVYFRRFGRSAVQGSSTPKATGRVASQGFHRHAKQWFCRGHRFAVGMVAKTDYAKLADPKYRVEVVA